MARGQIGNNLGVAACDIGGVGKPSNFNGLAGTDMTAALDIDNADTISSLRARLQVISATTYSDAELDKMTRNDLVYAVRLNEASNTIKQ